MRLLSILLGGLLFSIIVVALGLSGYTIGGILYAIVFALCQIATNRLVYKRWESYKSKKEMELLHPTTNTKNDTERDKPI